MLRTACCFCVAIVAACVPVHANQLVNPGFETPPIPAGGPPEYFGATGWTDFGGGTYTVGSAVVTPNSGAQSLKMFGGASGVYQQFAATPGQLWDGGAYVLNDAGDPMAGGQVAAVNIEWILADGVNQVPGGAGVGFITNGDTISTTPQGQWNLRPISGVAPAGTAFARFVLITGEFGGGGMTGGGGAPKYDDAFFDIRPGQVPEPASLALVGMVAIGLVAARRRR
ncbi:hypothetical protein Pla175_13320 [Pirellulimonas nuda]|uniref:Ice-binding protein C-terminal domain-containing protein n=1 Tax=Pirellulimonas nuda TaxID=2528009 RepID=A0A518D923_9BACT|nr:PEP-CTERM sorting domain-containing protein [Pirellulimonas nuda]QDU87965.1 hypothetical protein Pla175_13320 [Pirellulimonas nuda]